MPIFEDKSGNPISLIERGYNFLQNEEFDRATEYFNRALDLDAKAHEAYWGMLLAERQCKERDGKDLIRAGMCIDKDMNYQYACKYCEDKASRDFYESTAKKCADACHTMIVIFACAGKHRVAFIRSNFYKESSFSDKTLVQIHKTIIKKDAFFNFSREMASAFIYLLEIHTNNSSFSMLEKNEELIERVKMAYKDYMERLLKAIVSPRQSAGNGTAGALSTPEQKALEIENLSEIWAAPYGNKKSSFIGTDSKYSDISERWIFLLGFLTEIGEFGKKAVITLAILGLFDTATAYGVPEEYSKKIKAEFLEQELKRTNSIDDIEIYNKKLSQEGVVYRRGLEIIMAEDKTPERTVNKKYKQFLENAESLIDNHINSKQYSRYTHGVEIDKTINELKNAADEYKSYPQEKRDKAEKYIKGIEKYLHDGADKVKETWDAYLSEVDSMCAEKESVLRKNTSLLISLKEGYNAEEEKYCKRQIKKDTVVSSVLLAISAVFLFVTIFGAFYANGTINKPERIMPYSTFWYTLVSAALMLVGGMILFMSQISLNKANKKYKEKSYLPLFEKGKLKRFKYIGIANGIVICFTIIISILAAWLFVYAGINFKKSVGVIEISTVENIELVKKHPEAKFVLLADLDFQADLKPINNSIYSFSGEFDGQGHTISNISLQVPFIKYNNGNISNLNISNTVIGQGEISFVNRNEGNISNIYINGVTANGEEIDFEGIVQRNCGNISGCCVSGFYNQFKNICGLVGANYDDGVITNCLVICDNVNTKYRFYGFASDNSGTIKGCSFSGNVVSQGNAIAFIHVNKGVIERCFCQGNLSGCQEVSGFVDFLRDGKISDCYSQTNLTQSTVESGTSIGGFVCDVDNSTITNCYYSGNIKIIKGENGTGYSRYGGFIASAYKSNRDGYKTSVVSNSFCDATYSIGDSRKDSSRGELELHNVYGTDKEQDFDKWITLDGDFNNTYRSSLKKSSFVLNNLGWSPEIWDIKPGKLPTLLPYNPQ